jgi:hypothetical protein
MHCLGNGIFCSAADVDCRVGGVADFMFCETLPAVNGKQRLRGVVGGLHAGAGWLGAEVVGLLVRSNYVMASITTL